MRDLSRTRPQSARLILLGSGNKFEFLPDWRRCYCLCNVFCNAFLILLHLRWLESASHSRFAWGGCRIIVHHREVFSLLLFTPSRTTLAIFGLFFYFRTPLLISMYLFTTTERFCDQRRTSFCDLKERKRKREEDWCEVERLWAGWKGVAFIGKLPSRKAHKK